MRGARWSKIIAQAAVAGGQCHLVHDEIVAEDVPERVLGVHVGNHRYSARLKGHTVDLEGSVALHIWGADASGDTRVIRRTVPYRRVVPVESYVKSRLGRDEVVEALPDGQPRVVMCEVRDGRLMVRVEMDYRVEVYGPCRLWVQAYDVSEMEGERSAEDSDEEDDEEEEESSSDVSERTDERCTGGDDDGWEEDDEEGDEDSDEDSDDEDSEDDEDDEQLADKNDEG